MRPFGDGVAPVEGEDGDHGFKHGEESDLESGSVEVFSEDKGHEAIDGQQRFAEDSVPNDGCAGGTEVDVSLAHGNTLIFHKDAGMLNAAFLEGQ